MKPENRPNKTEKCKEWNKNLVKNAGKSCFQRYFSRGTLLKNTLIFLETFNAHSNYPISTDPLFQPWPRRATPLIKYLFLLLFSIRSTKIKSRLTANIYSIDQSMNLHWNCMSCNWMYGYLFASYLVWHFILKSAKRTLNLIFLKNFQIKCHVWKRAFSNSWLIIMMFFYTITISQGECN